MPKLMLIKNLLLFYFMILAMPGMTQTCVNESEIPSSTPTSDFIDHGDGTVTHKSTGLMWMKCPLGQWGANCSAGSANTFSWKEALEAADNSTFAGYSDWRLPNIKELFSIVEDRCREPSINMEVFPTTEYAEYSTTFWSSSPDVYTDDWSYVWVVWFFGGYVSFNVPSLSAQVRLVRSSQ